MFQIRSIGDKSLDPKYDFAGHFLVELISNSKTKFDFENIQTLLNELSLQNVKISKMAGDMTLQHLAKLLTEEQSDDYARTLIDRKLSLPAVEFLEGHINASK